MKPSEIIREGRNQLFERGWHQGDLIGPGGSVCGEGAVRCASEASTAVTRALVFLGVAVNYSPYFRWNDMPGRTFDEVVEAFDKAEKLAEAAEQ
jgi:hypothetical protein